MRDRTRAALLAPNNSWTLSPPNPAGVADLEWSALVEDRFAEVLRAGLLTVQEMRPPILKAERGFHYVKPSRKHSNYFIRGANLLVRGSEIDFLAFCVARYLAHSPSRICTDTGTINSIAYAVSSIIRDMFPDQPTADIDSFGSYAKIDDYPFPPQCLVLMSATTSNDLAKKLMNRPNSLPARVVTLIGPSTAYSADSPALLTLEDVGAADVRNYSEESCQFCKDGSTAIHIRDEHFLPFTPHTRAELLNEGHAKQWLLGASSRLIGKTAFRVHPVATQPSRRPSLFIDVEALMESTGTGSYSDQFRRMVLHYLPASVTTIVYSDDKSSRQMAQICEEVAKERLNSRIELLVLSASELFRRSDLDTLGGTIVVVCGVVNTGSSLTRISLALRNATRKNGILYLSLFTRMPTAADRQRVVSDLTYGKRPADFNFQSVETLYLPPSDRGGWSVWEREARFLREALSGGKCAEASSRVVLERRLQTIDTSGQTGMLDQLYWNDAQGQALKVRPGFAFWPKEGRNLVEKATQADVYFTISAVLHQARNGSDVSTREIGKFGRAEGERPWTQSEHQRVALSPYNFARYSDGVIQASLLRVADQRELDYSYSVELSRTLAEIVKQLKEGRTSQTGEAFDEFLLALADGRVQLEPQVRSDLFDFLGESLGVENSVSDSTRALVGLIRSQAINAPV